MTVLQANNLVKMSVALVSLLAVFGAAAGEAGNEQVKKTEQQPIGTGAGGDNESKSVERPEK